MDSSIDNLNTSTETTTTPEDEVAEEQRRLEEEENQLLEGVDLSSIIQRSADLSYVVQKNGTPYHVPNEGDYAKLYALVDAHATQNPDVVTMEYPYVPTIEDMRSSKLGELNSVFESIRNTAWVMSSLGFEADANEVANTNIDGLIKTVKATGQEPVYFCDKNNQYHTLSLAELETLQLEVIQNGQNLYAQKWTYRDAINAAITVEEINAVDIQFTMMDFTA